MREVGLVEIGQGRKVGPEAMDFRCVSIAEVTICFFVFCAWGVKNSVLFLVDDIYGQPLIGFYAFFLLVLLNLWLYQCFSYL